MTMNGELVCTVGGVFFDPASDSTCEVFGVHVPAVMVDKRSDAAKVHPVAQTEM